MSGDWGAVDFVDNAYSQIFRLGNPFSSPVTESVLFVN